jgi:hypothetical protein
MSAELPASLLYGLWQKGAAFEFTTAGSGVLFEPVLVLHCGRSPGFTIV